MELASDQPRLRPQWAELGIELVMAKAVGEMRVLLNSPRYAALCQCLGQTPARDFSWGILQWSWAYIRFVLVPSTMRNPVLGCAVAIDERRLGGLRFALVDFVST